MAGADEMTYFLPNTGARKGSQLKFGSIKSLYSQHTFRSFQYDHLCIFKLEDGRMGRAVAGVGKMAYFLPNTGAIKGAQLIICSRKSFKVISPFILAHMATFASSDLGMEDWGGGWILLVRWLIS